MALVLAEFGARAFSPWLEKGSSGRNPVGVFEFRNFVEGRLSLFQSAYPAQYDSFLGYIPRAGFSGTNNAWSVPLTIGPLGVRKNRPGPSPEKIRILAVGDSFTFGDQVGDTDTWPALLEDILAEPVANAGVFGYGLDQTVLRAEQMAGIFKPEILLVGLIPDDILRLGVSSRSGVAKPYFISRGQKLLLHNSPAPKARPDIKKTGWFRKIFGYSYLLDFAMARLGLERWWYVGKWKTAFVKNDVMAVSRLLADRLARLEKEKGLRVILVVQYTRGQVEDEKERQRARGLVRPLLDQAQKQGIETVDFFPLLEKSLGKTPLVFRSWYRAHMTPKGNRMTARVLARYLSGKPKDALPAP